MVYVSDANHHIIWEQEENVYQYHPKYVKYQQVLDNSVLNVLHNIHLLMDNVILKILTLLIQIKVQW